MDSRIPSEESLLHTSTKIYVLSRQIPGRLYIGQELNMKARVHNGSMWSGGFPKILEKSSGGISQNRFKFSLIRLSFTPFGMMLWSIWRPQRRVICAGDFWKFSLLVHSIFHPSPRTLEIPEGNMPARKFPIFRVIMTLLWYKSKWFSWKFFPVIPRDEFL